MSFTQRLLAALEAGLWKVVKVIIGANREFPYHDFKTLDDGDEPVVYQVGKTQVDLQGDQKKFFVSKSTLIISDVTCTIRFNSTDNAPITIRPNIYYEFLSNISKVYVSAIGTGGYIDMAFEGVLPQETRDAE